MSKRTTMHVSTNKGLVNKASAKAFRETTRDWVPVCVTATELVESVERGLAFAPVYKDNNRKTANFIRCGFIAADFDRGTTVDQARDNAFIHAYSAFIYTTASHTCDAHRFRVVFALTAPVTDAQKWADASFGLAHKLGSDPSIGDAARCFFGSTSAQVWMNNQTMPVEVFDELVAYGAELRSARKLGYPINSSTKFDGSSTVKLASGDLAEVKGLKPGTSLFCPYHDDQNPSAFVVSSWKGGNVGIHCRACMCTRWQADEDGYDFSAFDKLIARRLTASADAVENPDGQGLARYFPPDPQVFQFQSRFLPDFQYEPGITMVKSPKGTGKTEVLKKLIERVADGKYKSGAKASDRVKSVLLIGHRRALVSATAGRLDLRNYLHPAADNHKTVASVLLNDPDSPIETPVRTSLKTLAVCLDSLPNWNEAYVRSYGPGGRPIFHRNDPFDLVIIDEAEQVISHAIGETIQKKQGGIARCFDALKYEVANAKGVIVLDADLGMLTAHVLMALRPQDWQSRTRIIYNKPVVPDERRSLTLFDSEISLRHQLFQAIERNERCFVATNSKKMAKVIEQMIIKRFGGRVKMRTITSDNSRDADEISFVQNIKTEFLNLQVLICSPSLGTGIDITFADSSGTPGGARLVDQVFGFFYPLVNTHFDMDQQLFRVRNPGSVKVWISPARFEFSSNFDVVRDDLARAYSVPRAVTGRTPDGLVDYNPLDPILLICTHVTASQRASKNRLVELFCQLRESQGWTIERDRSKSAPTDERKNAEKAIWNANTQGLLRAPILDDLDYLDLAIKDRDGEPLTLSERLALERNKIERSLGVELTYDIIKLNYDGHLNDRIAALADSMKNWAVFDVILKVLADQNQFLSRVPKMSAGFLINCVLTHCGLADADGIIAGGQVELQNLEAFTALCSRNCTVFEEMLGQKVRADCAKNPVRQVNAFLRLAGLKLEPATRRKEGKKSVRSYGFEQTRLHLLMSLAAVYKAPSEILSDLRRRARAA